MMKPFTLFLVPRSPFPAGQARLKVLGTIAVVMAVVYVIGFTDLLRRHSIRVDVAPIDILHPEDASGAPLMVFALDDRYRLSALRVVQTSEDGVEQEVVWHLKGNSRSRPVDRFVYGATVFGMEPPGVPRRRIRLEPGQTYRLDVRAGRRRGEVEFRCCEAQQDAPG